MEYAAFVAAASVMQHMQPHPLAIFLRQNWLDLGKFGGNLIRFLPK